MSLQDQQVDFINSATKRLIKNKNDLMRRGHVAIAEGVVQAIAAINVMAITEWGIPSEKLIIMGDEE